VHWHLKSSGRPRQERRTIAFVFGDCVVSNFLWVVLGVSTLSIRENMTAPPSINPELPNLSHRSNLGVIVDIIDPTVWKITL
jgi:hypothetical protein